MLPKKNIGAITVMTSFLGLAASRLVTALMYYSCSKADSDAEKLTSMFGILSAVEFLLLIALAVGFALIFLYSEDGYSTGLLGASSMLVVLMLSAKFDIVKSEPTVFSGVAIAVNLCLLAIFGIYALYFYRRDMKSLSVAAGCAGVWFALLSFISGAAASASGNSYLIYAVLALVSAVCYGIAYFSQRQSFE